MYKRQRQSQLEGQLHFYRIDGILVGSVEPLPLEEAPAPGPVEVDLARCGTDRTDAQTLITAEGVTIAGGEMISTNAWTLQPGQYTVTLRGEGFDHSYIHCGASGADGLLVDQDIVFLTGEPEKMVFQFSVAEPLIDWCIQVHTLDDTPVQIDSITVEAG